MADTSAAGAIHLRDLLHQAWAGEVLGEAFFDAVAGPLPDHEMTWQLLARLESTTASLIEPVARAHGAAIDATTVAADGTAFGEATTELSGMIDGSLGVAAQFLTVYEELGRVLPPDDRWLAEELVTHEHALVACLEGVRDGVDGSAQVRAYLDRHPSALPGE